MKAILFRQNVSASLIMLTMLMSLPSLIHAQESKQPVQLHLEGRYEGQHITLRWGFAPVPAWRFLNEHGYILERYELDAQNQPLSNGLIPLTPSPVRPWPLPVWEQKKNSLDTFALIAAQCLLGKEMNMDESASFFRQLDMKAQESNNRASLALLSADLSPVAAEALGLRFTDTDIRPNRKYVYQLRVNNPSRAEFITDTAIFIVSTESLSPLPYIDQPRLIEGDLLLTLKWPAYKVFTAYHIDRSADGKNWETRTKKPFIRMLSEKEENADYIEWTDPVDSYEQQYHYRIRGIDGFGRWSANSPPVQGKSAPASQISSASISKCATNEHNRVILEWAVENNEKIQGFVVGHSQSVTGPWEAIHEQLLPAHTRTFTHAASEHERNFYRIWTIDIHGQSASSEVAYAIMNNSAPPASPQWIDGSIDSTGLVTLHWKSNTEPDLQGYQIYYAHQEDHIPVPLQSELLSDTTYSFTISLQNLSPRVWFYLKAADVYLATSELSKALMLQKPDKMPPVAAVIKDYQVRDTALLISWIPSSSDDLMSQQVFRRTKGTDWQLIANLAPADTAYSDTDIRTATLYEYLIRSTDQAGWTTPSESIILRSMPFSRVEPVKSLTYKKLAIPQQVELNWDYPARKDLQFRIFKINQQGTLEILAEIPSDKRSFLVSDGNGASGFAIRVIPAEGVASSITRTDKTNF